MPSVFFVTDVFLFLDKLYQSKLLIPLEEGDTKQSLAGVEGNKIKLLIGALRSLWRSSISKYIVMLFIFFPVLVVMIFVQRFASHAHHLNLSKVRLVATLASKTRSLTWSPLLRVPRFEQGRGCLIH